MDSSAPSSPRMPAGRAVLAVCGFSGSGKTTLLETVIPRLTARGLSVGAVKHDAHGFAVDRPGKDSDRLFRAGADVCLRGPGEAAWRLHDGPGTGLERSVDRLIASCDLVLVEGHKKTPFPKVWLEDREGAGPPAGTANVLETFGMMSGRTARLLEIIEDLLEEAWSSRPVFGGLLVGGGSRRMGRPKQLLERRGRSFAAIVHEALATRAQGVVALGDGPLPGALEHLKRLPDPPDLAGPMAGLLAALRWAPGTTWILAACDLPRIDSRAIEWLLARRRPGVRAVLPLGPSGRAEPLLAVYEPHVREALEELASRGALALWRLRNLPGTVSPVIPAHLAPAWTNVNRPEDLSKLPH